MALTVTLDTPHAERISRNLGILIGTITFDSSYPTGGEPLTPAITGQFMTLLRMTFDQRGGYLFEFDRANKKVKVLHPRAAIASTLAVSTPALAHEAGATTVTSTAATMPSHAAASCTISGVAGVAAGAGAEVPNGTNLSALTGVSFIAVGLI